MFSDASCGASQLFSYEFEQHAADIQKYVHLYTGKPGETEVAVYCPTTLYRLGGSLGPTITACTALRDLCEFDVLDELLIADGALTKKRYHVLILFQADVLDQPILDKISAFIKSGGKVIAVGSSPIQNVEGNEWPGASHINHVAAVSKNVAWLKELSVQLAEYKGFDGKLDGLWISRRHNEVFIFNSGNKAVETKIDGQSLTVEPHSIWFNQPAARGN
jgi:hypothetical protein